jgi:hypothetical protein
MATMSADFLTVSADIAEGNCVTSQLQATPSNLPRNSWSTATDYKEPFVTVHYQSYCAAILPFKARALTFPGTEIK